MQFTLTVEHSRKMYNFISICVSILNFEEFKIGFK